MSIYNLQYLQEMKTKEEYRKESFKKKYNYKPDINSKDTGSITKNGKSYKVDINKKNKRTYADLMNQNSKIYIGKDFFKLKGSNKNQRRGAALQHEIGHQNLHNINPFNKTVDRKNRTEEVFDNVIKNNEKSLGHNFDNLSKEEKTKKFSEYEKDKYLKYMMNTDENINKRNKSLHIAKKYETKDKHSNAEEFEADRYAANKTSARVLKRTIREINRINSKKSDNKRERTKDYLQRVKALNDKDMQNSEVYK